MTKDEENIRMRAKYGEDVDNKFQMQHRRKRIQDYWQVDDFNLEQKAKRLLFGIICVICYYIATVFFDDKPNTPGAMFGFDNHTLDQIVTNILMLPLTIYMFSIIGVAFFKDMSDREFKDGGL